MDQIEKTFTSEPRRLIGRIIIAVILGEAVWALIVSVMNNLIVPWLGDVMGQSSGLPTSFVQRPYNYPELFVSIVEVCIAGLVAAILNYFVQRPQSQGVQRVKSVKSPAPAGPVRMFPEPMKAPASVPQPSPVQAVQHQVFRDASPQNQSGLAQGAARVALAPEIKAEAVAPPSPMAPAPAQPLPIEKPAFEMMPAPVPPPVPPAAATPPAKPAPAQKTAAAKPKKPKEVYYNIVGEPMPSDDD